eukprot:TRINITY_DN72328_c0_g2_i1.p1 TRINITY_DN72328_c0_g2~~TRINITY_DN72328_c0_g2_i1.p1  ORF type:complete len:625 (+),score=134.76 TRINITY_DN72328_c0_g2_i1:95-1969(+)
MLSPVDGASARADDAGWLQHPDPDRAEERATAMRAMHSPVVTEGELSSFPRRSSSISLGRAGEAVDGWVRSAGATVESWTQSVQLGRAGAVVDDWVAYALEPDCESDRRVASASPQSHGSEEEWSASERLAMALRTAHRLGGRLSERVGAAQESLNDALTQVGAFDAVSDASSPLSRARRACEEGGQTAAPLLRKLKYAPLNAVELIGHASAATFQGQSVAKSSCAAPSSGRRLTAATAADCVSKVAQLARRCWALWLQRHEALTASERLYASLLSDARRTAALTAEMSAVEALLRAEATAPAAAGGTDATGDDSSARQEALAACDAAIRRTAEEAVSAFQERVRYYPCGRPCPETGYLQIARLDDDSSEVVKAFEARVGSEAEDLSAQAQELVVAPSLCVLAQALERRLRFWESEIEENWDVWSKQANVFHDTCRDSSDVWVQLCEGVESLCTYAEENRCPSPEETPPIVYIMPFLDLQAVKQRRVWEDMHDALVDVAVAISLLGAWTDYHHLQGDGEVLGQAQSMMELVLRVLQKRFSRHHAGLEAVKVGLETTPTWPFIAPLAEAHARARGRDACWWSPTTWSQGCSAVSAVPSRDAVGIAPMEADAAAAPEGDRFIIDSV